jgi:ABC-type transporter Mla subunit MlaD
MIIQIAASSEEQSASAEQITRNVASISSVVQENATGTQQIANAAEDLNSLATHLHSLVAKFTLGPLQDDDRTNGHAATKKYQHRTANAQAGLLHEALTG